MVVVVDVFVKVNLMSIGGMYFSTTCWLDGSGLETQEN